MYAALLKIGNEKHMNQFFEDGLIYMNSIDFFHKEDLDEFIQDSLEGVSLMKNYYRGQLIVNDKVIVNLNNIQTRLRYDSDLGNLFCLYGIDWNKLNTDSSRKQNFPIDDSKLGDGNTAVLITNLDEFFKRFQAAVKQHGSKLEFVAIEYINVNNFEGSYGWYRKPIEYLEQCEVRCFIKNKSGEPLQILIGNMDDIAIKLPRSELKKLKYGK